MYLVESIGLNPMLILLLKEGVMYHKGRKVSRKGGRKLFTKTAMKVHKKNVPANPMRGGIRL